MSVVQPLPPEAYRCDRMIAQFMDSGTSLEAAFTWAERKAIKDADAHREGISPALIRQFLSLPPLSRLPRVALPMGDPT